MHTGMIHAGWVGAMMLIHYNENRSREIEGSV